MSTSTPPHAVEVSPVVATHRRETVLIHAHLDERAEELASVIEAAGWLPLIAADADELLVVLDQAPTDLVLLAFGDHHDDGLELLARLRADEERARVPVVCVLDRHRRRVSIEAFARRADDVIAGHPHPDELIARLRARIERPSVPRTGLAEDPVTGALTPDAFEDQLRKERERVARGGTPGSLAFLSLDELTEITARHGSRARDEVLAQVVRLIKADGRRLDFVGIRRGVVALLLPNTPTQGAQARLDRLVRVIYDREFTLGGAPLRLTPLIGFTATSGALDIDETEERAWDALRYQSGHLDLHPTFWVPAMSAPAAKRDGWFERLRTPLQVAVQQIIVLGLPFGLYFALARFGIDLTGWIYLALVLALGLTALGIIIEAREALHAEDPPEDPSEPPPPASAIIAAYMPNEAPTIMETVEAFLAQDYPDLEIILAYNTPQPMAIEEELRAVAARDPRFRPLRIEGSVSKAQNVNAALAHVRGEFVGVFDADHHPAPGSFDRAWRWLSHGAGVVQGHCVVRNGDTNFVTRLVAAEFESIYAVSHPGRARLHGFGIFGGSNGYWRTKLLHRTRMRGSMLTEDIDSSMRVVQSGERIISDPKLVSTELAPETWGALWNQRLRWAQGWSQVSLRHIAEMVREAPHFRHRFGVLYLLGWRELYPWISLQMVPLLAFWWIRGDPPIDWFIPIFMATSLFTLCAGPLQIYYSYRLADPAIKRNRRWFVQHALAAFVFYTEWKNIIGRTAQLKEAMREKAWKVTPRSRSASIGATDDTTDDAIDDTTDDATDTTDDAPDDTPATTTGLVAHDASPGPPSPARTASDLDMLRPARAPDPGDHTVADTPAAESAVAEGPADVPSDDVHDRDAPPPTDEPARPEPTVVARADARRGLVRNRRHGQRRPDRRRARRSRPQIYDVERELQIYDVEQELDRDPHRRPPPPPPPPRDPAALAIYDVTSEEPTDAPWPPFVAASPATRRLFVADVEGALIEDPAALAPAAAPRHEPATGAVPTAATESGTSDGADVHVH